MHENYKTYVSSRILQRSIKRENGCIEYQGNWKHKYGLISVTIEGKRQSLPAHRAMYMAIHDKFDLPSNIQIRHKCDNTRCVNENHLIEGTAKDNMQDCIERGRKATKYRLHTRKRVLDDETIKAIRNEPYYLKQWHIAEKYDVSIGYVSKLRAWKAKTLI